MSQEVYWILCKCPKRELILFLLYGDKSGLEGGVHHLKAEAFSDTGGDLKCLFTEWKQHLRLMLLFVSPAFPPQDSF